MKLNKNTIIVSALALITGVSLAGSIGGTIAWYQYSTRANVSFLGQSSGISGNLQMRFSDEGDNAWRTRITYTELQTKLTAGGYALSGKVMPMTYGALDKDAALPEKAYVQPIAGVANMTGWVEAKKEHYAQFELDLRYEERDGVKENNVDGKNIAKDVYLSKLLIQEDYTNAAAEKKDLSDAVRIHIHAYKSDAEDTVKADRLISNQGGAIATEGKLNLSNNANNANDQAYSGNEFGFGENNQLQDVVYGSGLQTSYAADKAVNDAHKYLDANEVEQTDTAYPALVGNDNNKLTDLKYTGPSGEVDKKIGSTVAGDQAYLRVKVTIWVEGWQKLSDYGSPAKYSAIWDETKYINSKFNVGIQFAVQDAFAE